MAKFFFFVVVVFLFCFSSFTLCIDIQVISEISHTVTITLVSANHNCISSSDKFSDYDTLIALTA